LPFLDPGLAKVRRMPHLSELHGASTHLAVVAIPVFAILHFVRRSGRGGAAVVGAEPWALAASLVGVAASGVTGLLVWGQAQTMLRGSDFRIGSVHFWLGIAIAVVSVAVTVDWYLARRREGVWHRPVIVPVAAVLIVAGVAVQGYLGGRMTYDRAVGVYQGGELAQTGAGSTQLGVAVAKGAGRVAAGRQAFSTSGLGCASCHGDRAQGERGPSLAGGRELEEFRHVHGDGLFPKRMVSDEDFATINAWLSTLPHPRGGEGGGD
jgi:mono/diheme cytochrome c family protein